MGQVPAALNSSYGIVGDGRLARHFAHYFNLLRIPYRQWSRRSEREQGVPAQDALAGCDTVLVMISDSAIESWTRTFREAAPGFSGRLIHFSGSLVTPLAIGVHPLMSFSSGFYELSDYEKIPFVCEEGAPAFRDLFPKLTNPSFTIPGEQKAFYHALCVMSGNFTVLLWQKMFADLEKKLGVPPEAALPYLERIAKNLKADPKAALTGPLARGDQETIAKNLESLSGDQFRKIYESFVEAYKT